ncbi:MAG: DUF2284 domain-containing protein [Saccharofermentanales bacterium]|jgi:predicted metal-binding protein|nr:hypothetical protein [Clostridiales bacterium]
MFLMVALAKRRLYFRIVPRPVLDRDYRDIPRFRELCLLCPNYGQRWSCPDFTQDLSDYLVPYAQVLLVACQFHFDQASKDKYPGQAARALLDSFAKEKKDEILGLMLRLEREYPAALALSAGTCSLCETCGKADGQPCRNPLSLRYSLEALGYDISLILKDFFALELCWSDGSLPDYLTLCMGLAGNDREVLLSAAHSLEQSWTAHRQ